MKKSAMVLAGMGILLFAILFGCGGGGGSEGPQSDVSVMFKSFTEDSPGAGSGTATGTVTSKKVIATEGFCWGTVTPVTESNSICVTSSTAGTGDYSARLTGVTPRIAHYIRAWAQPLNEEKVWAEYTIQFTLAY